MVVNAASGAAPSGYKETPNPLRDGRSYVVEMRRLELLTPYMRRTKTVQMAFAPP